MCILSRLRPCQSSFFAFFPHPGFLHRIYSISCRVIVAVIQGCHKTRYYSETQPYHYSSLVDVKDFVLTGDINRSSGSYPGAFSLLRDISVASLFDLSEFRLGLLAPANSARTAEKMILGDKLDDY